MAPSPLCHLLRAVIGLAFNGDDLPATIDPEGHKVPSRTNCHGRMPQDELAGCWPALVLSLHTLRKRRRQQRHKAAKPIASVHCVSPPTEPRTASWRDREGMARGRAAAELALPIVALVRNKRKKTLASSTRVHCKPGDGSKSLFDDCLASSRRNRLSGHCGNCALALRLGR